MQTTISRAPSDVGQASTAVNAAASQTTDLQQQPGTPTQRPFHALRSVGRRALRGLGRLMQNAHVLPRQRASTPRASSSAQGPTTLTPQQAVSMATQLTRSSGARLQGGDDNGPSLEARAAAERRAHVRLNDKGEPDFKKFNPPAVGELLNHALGQKGQTYQARLTDESAENHFLLDQKGHVLHIKQGDTAMVAVRSSQLQGASNGDAPAAQHLIHQGANVEVAGVEPRQAPLQTLGAGHLGHMTGIHEDASGQQLRLHDDKLYEFDKTSASWVAPSGHENMTFDQLARQGNGSLYARKDDHLINLTPTSEHELAATEVHVPDLKAFSVSTDHQLASLSGENAQTLQILDLKQDADNPVLSRTLNLDEGRAEAKHIAIGQDRVYISDTEGRLYSARREDLANAGPELKLKPETHLQIGNERQVSGFISGDDGTPHVLIQDRNGQAHAHGLDEQNAAIKGGWNLSDALVLDNRNGLPGSLAPQPSNVFNLDRLGSVALNDQRVQSWDATTQDWKDTGIKDIDQLARGIDSQAYVLKNGTLSKLDVKPQYNPVAVGAEHSLHQPPRSTSVALGAAVEGLGDRVITAFAMLNDKQFVALDDTDRLTAHHKTGEPTNLSRLGLEGDVAHLALDEHHNLYASTANGDLYAMAKDDWQSPPSTSANPPPPPTWKKIPPPGPVESIRTADDNSLHVTLKDRPQPMQLKGRTWQPPDLKAPDHNGLSEMFDRLKGGEVTSRKLGVLARFSVNLAGRNGIENSNRAPLGEWARAHLFKPTVETPRVLKNIGNHIQHRHHGREGLRPVYDVENQVFKRLELLSDSARPAPAAGQDLKSRIANLKLGPQGDELLTALEDFRNELEDNSLRATRHMGKEHGQSRLLRQKEGLLNIHGELLQPSKRTQLSMKLSNWSEKLNVSSSGHNLIKELQSALTQVAPSAENHTGELLKVLSDNGMKLSHQKADVPLGRRRDRGDELALTKARVALDVVTLKDLGEVLDKAELLGPSASEGQLKQLNAQLSELRDKTYGDHMIKQVTDMGFTDHASLEASYDGIKSFLNGFKKADHATSVNMRAATGSTSQAELADKLKASLKQLEHPDDEIAMQRGYGGAASTPFIQIANLPFVPWPSASAGGTRNYSLNAERGDKGVTVYLLRDGAGNASAGVGGGKGFWPGNDNASADIGNNRSFTPAIRLGAEVTGTATATQRDGVVFTVPDEHIDHFVDDLFSGKLNPMDVMKKGIEHEVQKGMRFNFDLNASGTAELRGAFGLSEDASTPLSAAARFGLGGSVSVNLLNYMDYSLTQKGNTGELTEGGKNRVRAFNNLTGTVQARAQIAGTHTQPSSAAQSAVAPLGGSASLSIDSKTTKRVKFNFKEAEPLTTANLTKISTGLGKAFKDSATQKELTRLADATQPEYANATAKEKIQLHLNGLKAHFADKPAQNDEQYLALRALTRADVQQQTAQDKHSLLAGARFESSYTNLSRLDEQGLVNKLMSVVNPMHSPSNAERISDLLDKDPTLKSVLKQMQNTNGTLGRVRLELKDDVQDRIDQGSRDGTLSQKELAGLLADRNNMRIKSIAVFQSVSKADGFNSPLPVLGYSSTASLAVNKTLGKINFSYGQDQDTPKSYFLDGELSRPSAQQKNTVGALRQDGLELKR
ncbi:AvrE-family type 3 secretion system effector [Pseudomonas fluorescens]|uniref:AvrE-family type 3 secretion system effector n=1 Tax=Pseudomonas fluorescens TaxID=294 RepID=A0A944DXY3_PSEFL|nr:AvrE-family type 3 secretion system effector [Pseudomonas fluorescens]MBT2298545.1 AvrE-family type 3 secretion system effector [Pseudomonas fluorescens]MBT2310070.1 AvrE-family type 3 secretion system effector [Pseudomonas fluorescens]MBT2311094.1 AvrE-family type 3 secretion system effector [Pseudomonas fluorescens]MBT2319971.1 AvrE-family type 3 secretion system effector [Pseudomonas fluorescens]MBT2329001.1 AvrE-family type 3 secretion system effector [Pseudomonas fluorescens]